MKKLIFLTISLFSIISGHSQTEYFLIQSNKLFWQKVFEQKGTIEELKNKIIEKNNLTDLKESDSTLVGTLREEKIPIKKAGFPSMDVPIYLRDENISGSVKVDFKQNKYRITIFNLKLISPINDPLSQKGEIDDLEIFALNKTGEIKNQFIKFGIPCLNYLFTSEFNIVELGNSEW